MVVKAIERARFLINRGEKLDASPALSYFLKNTVSLTDFEKNEKALKYYSELDDFDIFSAFKYWKHCDDKVLKTLCEAILDRKLFKIEISNDPFPEERLKSLNQNAVKKLKLSEEEVAYLVFSDSTSNYAYNPAENHINILTNTGEAIDIAKASDQLNIAVLSVAVTKYYVFYPKSLLSLPSPKERVLLRPFNFKRNLKGEE